jgi:hypothetical protein
MRLSVLCILGFVGLAVVAALDIPENHPQGDRIPAGWKLDEIVDGALLTWNPQPALRSSVKEARILTWKIRQDARPLLVEQCIVWLRLAESRWILAHVFRHPLGRRVWCQAAISHGEATWIIGYDHPPTNQDLTKFLDTNNWWADILWWEGENTERLGDDDGFRLIDADVCFQAWQEAIHAKPFMSFPKGLEGVGAIPKLLSGSKSIQIRNASIEISIFPLRVQSEFNLHNLGAEATIYLGFPERSWKMSNKLPSASSHFSSFQCLLDEKLQAPIRIPEFFHPREFLDHVDRSLLVIPIRFTTNQAHIVKTVYSAPASMDDSDGKFLVYGLAPADSWRHAIESLDINVHVGEAQNLTTAYPMYNRRTGSEFIWEWRNFRSDPTRGLIIRWTGK